MYTVQLENKKTKFEIMFFLPSSSNNNKKIRFFKMNISVTILSRTPSDGQKCEECAEVKDPTPLALPNLGL